MMRYRTLGRTGLRVSVLGFGGIPIRKVGVKLAGHTIDRAIELGVNLFHTAPTYGDSASKMGRALRGRRDSCIIEVKIFGSTREMAEEQLTEALKMLRTDRIDIAQFRITEDLFDQGLGPEGGLRVLEKAQEAGTIDHIGITDHDPRFLASAIETGRFSNLLAPLNYVFDDATRNLIPATKKMDVGVAAMKTLSRGILTDVPEALSYVWSQDLATAIVGMCSPEEVEENARYAEEMRRLSKSSLERLRAKAAELMQDYLVRNGVLVPRKEGRGRQDTRCPNRDCDRVLEPRMRFCPACGIQNPGFRERA
jgi:aryl-alcohol dehydrogenase-like predicted oxidoreductase